MFFDRADGDRFEAFLDHAIAFAKTILRTDPTTDLRHVVGGRSELVSFLHAPFGGHAQPVRDIVVKGTVHLAKRNAALLATRCLLGGTFRIELIIDLAKILTSQLSFALVRHRLFDGDKPHHSFCHDAPKENFLPRSSPDT